MNGWKGIAVSIGLNLAVIAVAFRVKFLRNFILATQPLNSAQELKIATVGTLQTQGMTTQGSKLVGPPRPLRM